MQKGPFVDNEVTRKYIEKFHNELQVVSNIEYHSILNGMGWKRPWRWVPPFWSKENWIFQYQHILNSWLNFGWLILFLPEGHLPHLVLLWSVFVYAAVREYFQWRNWDWKIFMWKDRIIDVIGHLVGIEILYQIIRLIKS
jgi:hypothetical protein